MTLAGGDEAGILASLEVVVARKADFLNAVIESVDTQVAGTMTTYERRSLHSALETLVAELEPDLFLAPSETTSKTLDPSLALEDLDRERLWLSFVALVSVRYPDLSEELAPEEE